jgi:hypothetical protein
MWALATTSTYGRESRKALPSLARGINQVLRTGDPAKGCAMEIRASRVETTKDHIPWPWIAGQERPRGGNGDAGRLGCGIAEDAGGDRRKSDTDRRNTASQLQGSAIARRQQLRLPSHAALPDLSATVPGKIEQLKVDHLGCIELKRTTGAEQQYVLASSAFNVSAPSQGNWGQSRFNCRLSADLAGGRPLGSGSARRLVALAMRCLKASSPSAQPLLVAVRSSSMKAADRRSRNRPR